MRMADSRGLLGAKPLELICAAFAALPQSSLVAMTAWSDERTSGSAGLASAPVTPKFVSDGPVARTTTVLALAPLMTKPPIITLKPVCTWPRVEMLASRGESGTVGRPTESIHTRSAQAAPPCEGGIQPRLHAADRRFLKRHVSVWLPAVMSKRNVFHPVSPVSERMVTPSTMNSKTP